VDLSGCLPLKQATGRGEARHAQLNITPWSRSVSRARRVPISQVKLR
jgi:hypothetical protein